MAAADASRGAQGTKAPPPDAPAGGKDAAPKDSQGLDAGAPAPAPADAVPPDGAGGRPPAAPGTDAGAAPDAGDAGAAGEKPDFANQAGGKKGLADAAGDAAGKPGLPGQDGASPLGDLAKEAGKGKPPLQAPDKLPGNLADAAKDAAAAAEKKKGLLDALKKAAEDTPPT